MKIAITSKGIMSQRFFHVLFILLIGVISANTFTSCSGDDDDNGGGNNSGSGNGNNSGGDCDRDGCSWPAASLLEERYIEGLSQPVGATNFKYSIDTYYKWLSAIFFDCTAETDEYIKNWFDNNADWVGYAGANADVNKPYCEMTENSNEHNYTCKWKHIEKNIVPTYSHNYKNDKCTIVL